MDITLKSAEELDFDYFYDLRRLTMTEHFNRAGKRWDDAELGRHRVAFDVDTLKIILVGGVRVGFINLVQKDLLLEVSHFCIEPALQGGGIGTVVMKKVLVIARTRNLRVVLNVLIWNRASMLYERLGFRRTSGDDPLLQCYVWDHSEKHKAGPCDFVEN